MTLLVSLATVALVLDAVDGWVARRTRTTGMFGARFDAEVDAFLILVLSVYVARSVGAWVLAIGVARYGVSRRRLAAAMDARAATGALLAQGRRCDAGDRFHRRRRGSPVLGGDGGPLVVALACLPSLSAATCGGWGPPTGNSCGDIDTDPGPASRTRSEVRRSTLPPATDATA